MKLICPSCSAVHSAEAWQNDAVARQCLKLVCEMPHAVGSRCFAYLSLFRKAGNSLQWKTVLTLLAELKDRISDPYVQWKNQVARPCNAIAWGVAMDRVIENPPKRLPLKTHGYLRSVVYEIADEADKIMEVKKNQAGIRGQGSGARDQEKPERISRDEMREITNKNYRKRN